MNNKKRKSLERSKDFIEAASNIINDVLDEENDSLSNIPDNLLSSERANAMEIAVDGMYEVLSYLESATSKIDDIIL